MRLSPRKPVVGDRNPGRSTGMKVACTKPVAATKRINS